MIAVNVGDQDEVGFGQTGKLRRFSGIQIDRLASSFDQRAGVVQGSDFDGAGGGGEDLGLGAKGEGCHEEGSQGEQEGNWNCFHNVSVRRRIVEASELLQIWLTNGANQHSSQYKSSVSH